MKISTKGRYGVRLMLELALNDGQGLLSLKDIAASQEISEKYLEQIVILLVRSGLIRSARGSHGGYALAKKPEDISVGEVLCILENSLSPSDCVDDQKPDCKRAQDCVVIGVWRRVKNAADDILYSTTLADLVRETHKKNAESPAE